MIVANSRQRLLVHNSLYVVKELLKCLIDFPHHDIFHCYINIVFFHAMVFRGSSLSMALQRNKLLLALVGFLSDIKLWPLIRISWAL